MPSRVQVPAYAMPLNWELIYGGVQVTRFLIVLSLVLFLSAVLVPVAAAAPPAPNANPAWMKKAKAKVWGTNGSDGAAAGAAGRAARNGVNLPSAPSKPLAAGYRIVKRSIQHNSR